MKFYLGNFGAFNKADNIHRIDASTKEKIIFKSITIKNNDLINHLAIMLVLKCMKKYLLSVDIEIYVLKML
jgi:hypothetical protein